MSTPINNGGPAFPVQTVFNPHNGIPCHTGQYWDGNGMTLRDWFAGQAVVGIYASSADPTCRGFTSSEAAMAAYKTADAMLKAREVAP